MMEGCMDRGKDITEGGNDIQPYRSPTDWHCQPGGLDAGAEEGCL